MGSLVPLSSIRPLKVCILLCRVGGEMPHRVSMKRSDRVRIR